MTLNEWILAHPFLEGIARYRARIETAVKTVAVPPLCFPDWDGYRPDFAAGVPLLASAAVAMDLGPIDAVVPRVVDALRRDNIASDRAGMHYYVRWMAVDQAFAASESTRQLPFARRESVKLLKASYSSEDEALRMIDRGLRSFYESQGHAVDQTAVSNTVDALQRAYRHNLFPVMKVTWGTYPDNTGHTASPGCFRCHDGSHSAKDGSSISADCELCHKQVEQPPATHP